MYDNPHIKNKKNDPLYRPARNVTKGMIQDPTAKGANAACTLTKAAPPAAAPLTRDTCLMSGTCNTELPGRLGDGNWDFTTYWTTNHGTAPQPAWSKNPPSRYEVYRWEIDNGRIPDNRSRTPPGENGNPQCYTGSTPPSDNPDRRTLIMAVVNCIENGPISGNTKNIPVKAFVKTFLVEPLDPGKPDDIVVELSEVVEPGDMEAVLHDIVQLYR